MVVRGSNKLDTQHFQVSVTKLEEGCLVVFNVSEVPVFAFIKGATDIADMAKVDQPMVEAFQEAIDADVMVDLALMVVARTEDGKLHTVCMDDSYTQTFGEQFGLKVEFALDIRPEDLDPEDPEFDDYAIQMLSTICDDDMEKVAELVATGLRFIEEYD